MLFFFFCKANCTGALECVLLKHVSFFCKSFAWLFSLFRSIIDQLSSRDEMRMYGSRFTNCDNLILCLCWKWILKRSSTYLYRKRTCCRSFLHWEWFKHMFPFFSLKWANVQYSCKWANNHKPVNYTNNKVLYNSSRCPLFFKTTVITFVKLSRPRNFKVRYIYFF